MRTVYARERLAETIRAVAEDALDPIGANLTERTWLLDNRVSDRVVDDVTEATLDDLVDRLAGMPDTRMPDTRVPVAGAGAVRRSHD